MRARRCCAVLIAGCGSLSHLPCVVPCRAHQEQGDATNELIQKHNQCVWLCVVAGGGCGVMQCGGDVDAGFLAVWLPCGDHRTEEELSAAFKSLRENEQRVAELKGSAAEKDVAIADAHATIASQVATRLAVLPGPPCSRGG